MEYWLFDTQTGIAQSHKSFCSFNVITNTLKYVTKKIPLLSIYGNLKYFITCFFWREHLHCTPHPSQTPSATTDHRFSQHPPLFFTKNTSDIPLQITRHSYTPPQSFHDIPSLTQHCHALMLPRRSLRGVLRTATCKNTRKCLRK